MVVATGATMPKTIEEVDLRVDRLEEKIDDLTASVARLEDKLDASIARLEQTIEGLAKAVAMGFKRMDHRFDLVEDRLERLEAGYIDHEERLGILEFHQKIQRKNTKP